jgi:hypothetical protein
VVVVVGGIGSVGSVLWGTWGMLTSVEVSKSLSAFEVCHAVCG